MALDFGDAGLFDPLTPQNGKKSNNGNSKKFSFEKNDEDDENENVRLNDSDDDRDLKDGGDGDFDPDQDDEEDDLLAKGFPLDILDCIKGYEEVSFEQTSVPPPPFEEEPTEIEGLIKKEEGAAEDKVGGEDFDKEGGGDGGAQEGAAQQGDKVSFWAFGSLVMRIKLTSIQYRGSRHSSLQIDRGTDERLEKESTKYM